MVCLLFIIILVLILLVLMEGILLKIFFIEFWLILRFIIMWLLGVIWGVIFRDNIVFLKEVEVVLLDDVFW